MPKFKTKQRFISEILSLVVRHKPVEYADFALLDAFKFSEKHYAKRIEQMGRKYLLHGSYFSLHLLTKIEYKRLVYRVYGDIMCQAEELAAETGYFVDDYSDEWVGYY